MKKMFLLGFILFSFAARSQVYIGSTIYGRQDARIKPTLVLHIPSSTDTLLNTIDTSAQIRIINGQLKYYLNHRWNTINSSISYTDSAARAALKDSLASKQPVLNGAGILKLTGTISSYITDNSTNWNTAYNRGDFRTYGLAQANALPNFNNATGFSINNNVNPAAGSNLPSTGYSSVITMGNNTAMSSIGGQIAISYAAAGGAFQTADLYTRAKSGVSTWFGWNKYWNDGNWFSTISTNDYFDDGGTAKTTNVNRVGNTLYGIIDPYTNEYITYTKITTTPDNQSIPSAWVDGVMIRKKGTEFFLRNFSDGVNVKWFGAVGDVKIIEQTSGVDYGKVYKADGTIATDNTIAFQKAIDFIHNYTTFLLNKTNTTYIGYHSGKPKIYIPSGSYFVSTPEIFSKARVTQTYSEAGLFIEGDGKLSSQIIYRNDGDTSKYLIENNNAWQSLYVKDMSFGCVKGVEKIYHESSTGTAGMTTFSNVGFFDFLRAVVVDGTSLNADRMLFDRCQSTSNINGNIFFLQNSNTQAVKHTFRDCSITAYNGTMFENNASGDHIVIGCSLNAYGNTTIFRINPTGSELGEQVIIGFSCYTNKIELHDQAVYADIKGGYIHVYSEVLSTNYSTAPYQLIIRNRLAGARFDKCVIKNFPVALINSDASSGSYYDDRPFAELMNCTLIQNNWLDSNIYYFSDNAMTATMSGTDTSAANIGRARVYNSITKTGGVFVNSFNDGAPYSWLGNTTRTNQPIVALVRDSKFPTRGLPTPSFPVTFNIPKNTMLFKLGISKTGDAQTGAPNVMKWYLKDADGTLYATLQTTSANDIISSNSYDLYKPLNTNNSRTFILSADAANGSFYAQGFALIQYQ